MSIFESDSLEEIQNWVSNRIDKKQAFRICGKGSRFVSENSRKSANNFNDFLSLKNLNGIRFYDPEDMVVGVEAGMGITLLQEMLEKSNMLLPVNPWFPDSSVGSIG